MKRVLCLILILFPTWFAMAQTSGAANPAPTATPAGVPPLTDAQIATVLQVVNKAEVRSGQMAQNKAQNAEVKKFASQMVIDHGRAQKDTEAAMKKLKVKPQEFSTAMDLQTSGEQSLATLEKLSGADFDKAFVADQIKMHREVLSLIDTQLMPAATNGELKAMVRKARPKIEAHLRHAEALQAKL